MLAMNIFCGFEVIVGFCVPGCRNDKRFFLKTQNKREVMFLLSNLQAYMEHLEKYPHSLLVRFLGKSSAQEVAC